MDSAVYALSQFSLFAGLDEATLEEIALNLHERTFEPEQVIVLSGESCTDVYLVVRGFVRARRLSLEGREYVLDYYGPHEVFNMVPAIDGGTTLATVEAITNATLYLLPCSYFSQLIQRSPALAMAVVRRLAHRVRYLSDRVEDLALHTVRTRLARFLLSRARTRVQPSRHWTQEEIAAHIGTVRDVVGRTLRSFSREGLIRRERGRLVIVDGEALKQAAMQE
jgi:CRP/FNR family cyclic AMP-dependent transcriptional regulator